MNIQNFFKPRRDTPGAPKKKISLKRKLAWSGVAVVVMAVAGMGFMLWSVSSMLLFPSVKGLTKDFAICNPEVEQRFGEGCGNLRTTHAFTFSEVSVPSVNGYNMTGWFVKAADNGKAPAKRAIMLVHAGGSDRREDTRHINFYLNQGFDVLTFDQGCAGEAPCPVQGLTYGARESADVLSAYLYLTDKYDAVYAMGSSVGASSILVALPEMPKLVGVIVENPFTNFERLIKEAPESKGMPEWMGNAMIGLAEIRGQFDGLRSPKNSLPLAKGSTPVFFIHSKEDKVVAYTQTQDLVSLYKGPKTTWFPEKGEHAFVQNADPATYEQRIADFLRSLQ